MKILNYGSLNIDDTYRVEHIVRPGETVTSRSFERFPGGKGLNQSIALAQAGAPVYHGGCIGPDGAFLLDICHGKGVDTSLIRKIDTPTGHAMIQVAEDGQNSIVLLPGANRMQRKEWFSAALEGFEPGDWLLIQNEINGLCDLIPLAKARGLRIAFNPSPFDERAAACPLELINLFFLNEVEGEQLTGEREPEAMLEAVAARWPGAATVLTLGAEGALFARKEERARQPAFPAAAVDTTGAGDTFTGFFLAEWLRSASPAEALSCAAMAASIAVTRPGAAASIPSIAEVRQALAKQND